MENLLKVGFGRVDITPDEMLNLAGYGNDVVRISEEIRDNLYGTCIAFTDGNDNTALLFTVDGLQSYPEVVNPIREDLSQEHGIPAENILIASTHSHSTPATYMTNPVMMAYREKYSAGLKEAARKALADRTEATIQIGNAYTENMNWVRHYKLADGSYAGSNFGTWKTPIVGHSSQADTNLQVIKFHRPGTKDILLTNFQAHPCHTGGIDKKVISADYIGDMRKFLEEKTGARCAHFQGAAGNHGGVSVDKREVRTEDSAEYGKLLGEYVLKALKCTRSITGDMTVSGLRRDMDLPYDHSDGHLVEQAKEIQKVWHETYDRPRCNKLANAIGQNSIYAVGHIIARADRPERGNMPIYALRVGPLGFAGAPYEMFGCNGMHIKEWSPYTMTFVVTHCNGAYSYLASKLAFKHGCYEVDSRRYPEGTAELLADNFVEMLKELK